MRLGTRGEAQKPQHSVFDALQDAHPTGKGLGINLVVLIEVGEDEGILREPIGPTCEVTGTVVICWIRFSEIIQSLGDLGFPETLLVRVREVGVRQIERLLAVEGAQVLRDHHGVADDVVDVVGAQRAAEAQELSLYRRGTKSKDFIASAFRVAVEIDEDVDLVNVVDVACEVGRVHVRHIEKVLDILFEEVASVAAIGRCRRVQEDFKLVTIVIKEERLVQQLTQRVVVEIGGDITYAKTSTIFPALKRQLATDSIVSTRNTAAITIVIQIADAGGMQQSAGGCTVRIRTAIDAAVIAVHSILVSTGG